MIMKIVAKVPMMYIYIVNILTKQTIGKQKHEYKNREIIL